MGSYRFTFRASVDQEEEIRRLQWQAGLFWQKEKAVLDCLGLSQAKCVLDIGCGAGFLSKKIADNYDAKVIGVERCDELLCAARSYHAGTENLSFIEASAYDTSLADQYSDFIYCRLLYQHLTDPAKAALEAFRVCRKGGRIAILDIDSRFQLFSKALPAVDKLMQIVSEAQAELGGDRQIGCKLPLILKDAGFGNIRVHLEPISTLDITLDQFCALTLGFVKWTAPGKDGAELYAAAMQELEKLQGQVFGMLAVWIVSGTRE